jgi:uncharacterized protein
MITSAAQLRQLYRSPGELPRMKILDSLDTHCRAFIATSPFLVLATRDSQGNCDASPRGDRPGFVEVLDEKSLLLVDKPGNNRIDSLLNIVECPNVGMLFLVPGVQETLRVNGRATITTDAKLLEKHKERGRVPVTGLLIEIDEAFLHCSRSLLSAGLWKPETWPNHTGLASASKVWADHIALMKARQEQGGQ